jgi:hypothetical protein
VRGEHDHPGRVGALPQPRDDLQPAAAGQLQVDQRHPEPDPRGQRERVRRGVRDPGAAQVGLRVEGQREGVGEDPVVVDQQHRDRALLHRTPSILGRSAVAPRRLASPGLKTGIPDETTRGSACASHATER